MKIKELNNGIKIITYQNDNAFSATIGVWVRTGAVDENEKTAGISHFIEHMMFKGTKTRNAKEIAMCMDSVGGQINAFTAKECTCYNATVTYEHIGRAINLLADMVKNSLIDEGELNKERGVILEEINMVDDSPDDVVHRLHCENHFAGSKIANSVIGNKTTVSSFNSKNLKDYINKNYTGDRIVISIAGKFNISDIEKMVEDEFKDFQKANDTGKEYDMGTITRNKKYAFKNMQTEQTHICLGFDGFKINDPDIYSLHVLNTIIGGGMSSRLFQSIREERALCYTIYSFSSSYMNTGGYTIYSATNKSQVKELISVALSQINSIIKEGPTQKEIEMAKEQLKGGYILGIESTGGRMNAMGRSLLLKGSVSSVEDQIQKINSVSMESIQNIVGKIFNLDNMSATFVGNITQEDCESFI